MNDISAEEQSEIKEILRKLYPSTSFNNKTITIETYGVVERLCCINKA